VPPNVLLDLNGVVNRSEDEAPFRGETVDRRNEGTRPRSDDHSVVRKTMPVGEADLSGRAVDHGDRHAAAIIDAP
jgi:hypothetical protein